MSGQKVQINGYDFLQQNVTSDGRCFSASVLLALMANNQYSLYSTVMNNADIKQLTKQALTELDQWMQDNIIKIVNNKKVQLTCDFVKAVYSSEMIFLFLPENLEKPDFETNFNVLEQTFSGFHIENACFKGDQTIIQTRIMELQANQQYQIYKLKFLEFCRLLTVRNGNSYTYAEPEAGLAQIIVNAIKKNIAIVDNDNVVFKFFFVNYNKENDFETIFIKKLDYEHYHALVPISNNTINYVLHMTPSKQKKHNIPTKNDTPLPASPIHPPQQTIRKSTVSLKPSNSGFVPPPPQQTIRNNTVSLKPSNSGFVTQTKLSENTSFNGPKTLAATAIAAGLLVAVIAGGKSHVKRTNKKKIKANVPKSKKTIRQRRSIKRKYFKKIKNGTKKR